VAVLPAGSAPLAALTQNIVRKTPAPDLPVEQPYFRPLFLEVHQPDRRFIFLKLLQSSPFTT